MTDITEIRRVVVEELDSLIPNHGAEIKDSDHLLRDLMLTGDDASIFALQVAKRLGIAVPIRDWKDVSTVGDAIKLLASHAR